MTVASHWQDWQQPQSRAKPIRREREPALEVEPLTDAETAALRLGMVAANRASCARLRERLISSGHIRPLEARIASDGTTIFRNVAGATVFKQGHLTAKMIAATHPAELEGAERQDKKRERVAAGRRGK